MIGMLFLYLVGTLTLQTSMSYQPPLHLQVSSPAMIITAEPILSADAAIVMEESSGMVIYNKNAHNKHAIASLTKLMTSLLILENTVLQQSYIVPASAVALEGRKAGLFSGEELSIADLLRAALIHSGNDAAQTLAIGLDGSNAEFVKRMNLRAYYLGMKESLFANPHGLDHPDNYSSAFDVALLAKKILEFDFVRSTVQRTAADISDRSGAITHQLETTNELLSSDFPVYGLKTGTTDAAGQCFVGLIKIAGKNYIIVILGSENRFQDTKALIWALRNSENINS